MAKNKLTKKEAEDLKKFSKRSRHLVERNITGVVFQCSSSSPLLAEVIATLKRELKSAEAEGYSNIRANFPEDNLDCYHSYDSIEITGESLETDIEFVFRCRREDTDKRKKDRAKKNEETYDLKKLEELAKKYKKTLVDIGD